MTEPKRPDNHPEPRPWSAPTIERLPKLTELTLQSMPFGSPIGGGPGVF